MMIYTIYLITNIITGMRYVGQTNCYDKRMNTHKSISKNSKSKEYLRILYQDIRLYGWDSFTKEVVLECQESEADKHERYYIKAFGTLYPSGYNLDSGGNKNKYFSFEVATNLSIIAKKRFEDPKQRERLRQININYWNNLENREKAKFRTIKRFSDPKQREIMRINGINRFKDPKKRLEYSIAHGGKPFEVYKEGQLIKIYINRAECARDLGLSSNHIIDCLRGRQKTSKGYTFKFAAGTGVEPV